MRAGLVEIAVWCGVLTAIVVVSISSLSPVELIVAGLSALGAAFAARRMRLATGLGWQGARHAARATALLPGAVLRGCAALLTMMVRNPEGAVLRRIALRRGVDAGWAGVMLAASPDTCVIDIPRDDEVLVHALSSGAGPVEMAVRRLDRSQ
ncbi:hypothetical protein ACWCP6_19110 [Streptomyces sp. NPDC002004]